MDIRQATRYVKNKKESSYGDDRIIQSARSVVPERRIELKIKLRTLALRCGSSIGSIERGSASVKIGSWFAVAEALGLAEVWQGLEKKMLKTRVRS